MKKLIFGGLIIAISIFVLASCSLTKTTLTPEQAKTIAETFINENLVSSDNPVTISQVTEENGVYKLVVNFSNGQTVDSFITKDGQKFFTESMDTQPLQETDSQVAGVGIVKNDKPKVELFVMSYCPYGTQMEKAIIPVIEALGDKIDFQLKFCDYAMHGKKELDEQLNQYCLQKNEPEKFIDYLKCFLEQDIEGQSAKCLSQIGINNTALSQCVAAADKEFKVTEMYNDSTTWLNGSYPVFNVQKQDNEQYGVAGSPGLVINGTIVVSNQDYCPADKPCVVNQSLARNPDSLLKVICEYFITSPDVCVTELSSTIPAPGFGFENTGSDTAAQCD